MAADILPLEETAWSKVQPPELRDFLINSKTRVADTKNNPVLARSLKGVATIVENLLTPAERAMRIHVILVRDTNVNAFYTELPNKERVVAVNIGLLGMIESDDELAFVLGHELEHGHSQIDEFVGRNAQKMNTAEKMLRTRSHEPEVDIKSIVRRLQPNGYNPYAGIKFLSRLRDKYGDGFGHTHTATSAREDLASGAIVAMKHLFGEEIPEENHFKHDFVNDFQINYWKTDALKSEVRARIQKIIDRPYVEVAKRFKEYRANDWDHLFRGQMGYEYGNFFGKRKLEIHDEAEGILEKSEVLEWEAKLLRRVQHEIDGERERFLNAVGKLSYDKLKILYTADARVGYEEAIRSKQEEIATTRKELQVSKEKLATESDEEKKQDYAYSISYAEKKIRETEVELKNFFFMQAQLGDLIKSARSRQSDWVLQMIPHFRDLRFYKLTDDLAVFFKLPQADQEQWVLRMLEEVILARQAEIDRDKRGESTYLNLDSPYCFRLFELAFRVDKAKASSALEKYLDLDTVKRWAHSNLAQVLEAREVMRRVVDSGIKASLLAGASKRIQDMSEDPETFNAEANPDFVAEIDNLESANLLSAEFKNSTEYREAIREYQDSLVTGLRRLAPEASSGLTDRQLFALISLAQPKFHERLGASLGITKNEMLSTAVEILTDPEKQKSRGELFKKILRPSDNIYENFERFADFEHLDSPKNELLFRYLSDLNDVCYTDFYRDSERRPIDPSFELQIRFSRWLRKNRPEKSAFIQTVTRPPEGGSTSSRVVGSPEAEAERATWPEIDNTLLVKEYSDLKEARFKEYLNAEDSKLSRSEQIKNATLKWTKEFEFGFAGHLLTWTKSEPEGPVLFLNAFISGLDPKAMESFRKRSQRLSALDRRARTGTNLFAFEKTVDTLFDEGLIRPQELEALKDLYIQILNFGLGSSARTDRIFDFLWTHSDKLPDFRQTLVDAQITPHLYFEANRLKVVEWDLERQFSLKNLHQKLLSGEEPVPSRGSERPLLAKVIERLNFHFPEKSYLKNKVIQQVATRLLTNDRETEHLFSGDLYYTNENWYEAPEIQYLDAPHLITSYLRTNKNRYEFVLYLLDLIDTDTFFRRTKILESPLFGISAHVAKDYIKSQTLSAKRKFREADPLVRSYALMTLLDRKDGLLSDAIYSEKVYSLILGDYAKDKIARRIFEARLKAMPESDSKVELAAILASFVESPQKRASISRVLSAMTALGVKGGQVLRTSGLAKGQLAKDLDEFFNLANPPARNEPIDRLRRAFGTNDVHIVEFRQLAGSGSVNFVMVADIKLPNEQKPRRIAFRFRRENIVGQIRNQNEIWMKIEKDLQSDPDIDVRRAGQIIEEIREPAMETLRPGKSEVSGMAERKVLGLAEKAYASPKTLKTGYRVEVNRVDEVVQSLILPEFQDEVTAFEYIEHTPLDQFAPDERADHAEEIARSEQEARSVRGVFGIDGHPGNWLTDSKNKRYVRIDNPQTVEVSQATTQALNDSFGLLLTPKLSGREQKRLGEHLRVLMIGAEGRLPVLTAIINDAVRQPSFPSYRAPIERLYFLREKIDEALTEKASKDAKVRLTPEARMSVASMMRSMVYREYLGPARNLQMLSSYYPVPRVRIWVHEVKERCKKLIEDLRLNTIRRRSR